MAFNRFLFPMTRKKRDFFPSTCMGGFFPLISSGTSVQLKLYFTDAYYFLVLSSGQIPEGFIAQ